MESSEDSDHDQDCNPNQPIQLSEAEMSVLRECRVNSLYLRGLPLGVLSAVVTRYAANNYYPHVKRWAGFYYTASFSVGLVLGVASYRKKCFEKIMNLDNSRLAEQVRGFQKRAAGFQGKKNTEFDTVTDKLQRTAADSATIDQQANDSTGGWNSSSAGRSEEHREDDIGQRRTPSYEELRKMHREKQAQKQRRQPRVARQDEEGQETSYSSQYDMDVLYDKPETYSSGASWDTDYKGQSPDETSSEKQVKGTWPKKPRERTKTNLYGDDME